MVEWGTIGKGRAVGGRHCSNVAERDHVERFQFVILPNRIIAAQTLDDQKHIRRFSDKPDAACKRGGYFGHFHAEMDGCIMDV